MKSKAIGIFFFATIVAFSSATFGQAKRGPTVSVQDNLAIEKDIEYGRAGELPLKLDVIRPKDLGGSKRPAIVWVHGGGWQGGDKSSGLWRLSPLVSTGEVVGFSVAYRLTHAASWPAQIHDCKAAIRWVRAHSNKYNVDPDRIGVWGSSAGGHLVSMLGTSGDVKELEGENGTPEQSSRVRCVVDFCGPSDFPAYAEKIPALNSNESPISKLLGGFVNDKLEIAKQASPVTHVTKDDPPFLIVHGTKDPLVPLSQAERLHAALKKAGVSSTFVRIEEGGHGIGGPEVSKRVSAFLQKQLLGKDVEILDTPILPPVAKK